MPSDQITGGNWNVPGDWTNGLPANGDSVTATGSSVDNIGSLSLASLLLEGTQTPPFYTISPADVTVTGGTLAIGALSGTLEFSLYAGNPGTTTASPVLVTVGTFTASTVVGQVGAFGTDNTLILPASTSAETYIVGNGGTIEFTGTVVPSGEVEFVGGTFAFQNPGTIINSLFSGYGAGDTIELPGTTVISLNYLPGSPNQLTVVTNAGTFSLPNLYGGTSALTFTEAVDPNTGLEAITAQLPCYAAGTCIATPAGEVPIEALRLGDLVLTADHRCVPIRWIGHRRIDLQRHPAPSRVTPIRIARHTFAPGAPWRDLLLSPDHAVFVDGVLIPIRYLCDGHAIAPAPRDSVTYYHLELPCHDVLLANGLPAESYLETGARAAFENGGHAVQAHPDFAPLAWEAEGFAPLAIAGPKLDAVRARLASRRVQTADDPPPIRPTATAA